MYLRDKWEYPIEIVKGKYFENFIRYLIHTNIKQTWKRRKEKKVSINYNWDNHLNDCNCMVKK